MKKRIFVTALTLFVLSALISGDFSAQAGEDCICGKEEDGSCKGVATNDQGIIICSNRCLDFSLESIPVGDFSSAENHIPMNPMGSQTQGYNTAKDDGYCEYTKNGYKKWADMLSEMCRQKEIVLDENGDPDHCIHRVMDNYVNRTGEQQKDENGNLVTTTASMADQICWNDKKEFWQHDGIDLGGKEKPVIAPQNMLIIASQSRKEQPLWGESIVGAVRTSVYSEEIITYHFNHLHDNYPNYTPTRRYNACWTANKGEELGLTGKTGKSTGFHLHYKIRHWRNIDELKAAINSNSYKAIDLYGYGYGKGNDERLYGHLDPRLLIENRYADVQEDYYYHDHARKLRYLGIEFGEWDSNFHGEASITKGETARWLSIASNLGVPWEWVSPLPVAVFPDDVSQGSRYYSYVQNLAYYPQTKTVLNRNVSCEGGSNKFCPEAMRLRAEAWKMIVLAFYEGEYMEFLKNDYPGLIVDMWDGNAHVFTDVPIVDWKEKFFLIPIPEEVWFAPYIYFGVKKGLIATHDKYGNPKGYFYPTTDIKKAEFAKWTIDGYEYKFGDVSGDTCAYICPEKQYCYEGTCHEMPTCVTDEGNTCPVGGGVTLGFQLCTGMSDQSDWETFVIDDVCTNLGAVWDCNPMPEGGSGVQVTNHFALMNCGVDIDLAWKNVVISTSYDDQINWGMAVEGSSGTVSAAFIQPQQITFDPGEKTPLRIAGKVEGIAIIGFNLTGSCFPQCSSNEFCVDGICCQIGLSLCGLECLDLANDPDNCGACGHNCNPGEICNGDTNSPQCVTCTDTYIASTLQACFANNQQENITLCLQVQQVSGANWEYKICRSGGNYTSSYAYTVEDINHGVQFNDYLANQTYTCVPFWKPFSVDYISGYGASNGVGMVGKVTYPVGCSQSSCRYKTGTITIRKECQ